ncbi:MAG: HutD family protein [Pseudomonadota bacterium]
MIAYLPAAGRVAKPWKNGGGSTADIVVEPAGAGLDDFEWRISVATITGNGPFSEFKGVDRSLSLLSDAPLRLLVDEVCFPLDKQHPTLRFSGEARVRAEAQAGPHTVLNVMSRRDCFAHLLSQHAFTAQREIELDAAINILFVQSGECQVQEAGLLLQPHDALLVKDEKTIRLHAGAAVSLIAVAIRPA